MNLAQTIRLYAESDQSFTQSFDGQDWAKAFVDHVKRNPSIAADLSTMTGWFANAIMRGYDTAAAGNRRIRAGGPGSGRHKESYTVNKGVPWETSTGYATKTGSKDAQKALLKIEYFAQTNGFKQTRQTSGHAPVLNRQDAVTNYQDNKGQTLMVSHDPGMHKVNAHLDADDETHTSFKNVMSAKNFKKLQYENAVRQWSTDPRNQLLRGRAWAY